MENKKVVGCDIGNVIRNNLDGLPIPDSVETIKELTTKFDFVFISKCKDKFKENSNKFLTENGLDSYKVFYCLEYDEKVEIAKKNNITIMIDDKIQVLQTFPSTTLKIWLCDDYKKIEGTKKYQKEFYDSVSLANNWEEVKEILLNI
jgi:uncharacterized HAD superfamily protein